MDRTREEFVDVSRHVLDAPLRVFVEGVVIVFSVKRAASINA